MAAFPGRIRVARHALAESRSHGVLVARIDPGGAVVTASDQLGRLVRDGERAARAVGTHDQTGCLVGEHRSELRPLRRLAHHRDLHSPELEWDVHPRLFQQRRRPRAGCYYDHARTDRAAARDDPAHRPALDEQPLDGAAQDDAGHRGSQRLRTS
jgi:hypothetical protein